MERIQRPLGIPLHPQRPAQLVICLPLVGVGVAHGQPGNSLAEILLPFLVPVPVKLPFAHGQVAAAVQGVAAEGLQIIALRVKGGVAVLLNVQPVQVQFLHSGDVLRFRGNRVSPGRLFSRKVHGLLLIGDQLLPLGAVKHCFHILPIQGMARLHFCVERLVRCDMDGPTGQQCFPLPQLIPGPRLICRGIEGQQRLASLEVQADGAF